MVICLGVLPHRFLPALKKGAWAYVEKPFTADDLLRVLRAASRTTMGEAAENEQRQMSSFLLPS